MNPGTPGGRSRGWTTSQERDHKEVRQWLGDWKDAGGNVVRYVLSYKYPAKEPDLYKVPPKKAPSLGALHVAAIYTPAAVYQKQLEEISKQKPAAPAP